MSQRPVPFLGLFKYATRKDLLLLAAANVFILYSSLNIPLVNIVYGLMMRDMNDFVAQRAQIIHNDTDHRYNTTSSTNYNYNNDVTPYYPNNNQRNDTTYSSLGAGIRSSHITDYSSSEQQTLLTDASTKFMNDAYTLCMIVILFGITRFVALYLALLFFSIAASNQAKRVKLLFFKSLLRQEVAWFDLNRTGDFAIRITSDLSKFEDGVGEKIALCMNALFAWMSSIISSFYYGWELTLVCLILVPLTIIITTTIAEFQALYSLKETGALSRAFNVCHEVISSIRTVLSFSGQQKEATRFKKGLDNAYSYGLKRNLYAGLNLGFTWMSGYLGFAICLLYSTKFYKPENIGLYDEAHIITILWSAAGCVFLLNRMMPFIEVIQMARGSASNLFAVIERKSHIDVTDSKGLVLDAERIEANVRFENVTFTYPVSGPTQQVLHEAEAVRGCPSSASSPSPLSSCATTATGSSHSLSSSSSSSSSASTSPTTPTATTTRSAHSNLSASSSTARAEIADEELIEVGPTTTERSQSSATISNMSLEVKSGQTIALVGPSGSGKSTALALLQRFYEIDAGSIKLADHDIRELNLGWLREQFGVVTQEPVLFDMSIADNIRLGARPSQPVSDYDIEQAARSANAHSFIAALPAGYETRAGARGVQLSGGQKQRIAIARALIRQPKILLLDEATSALDLESESVVQKALDAARIGRTTFVVAHRLSTVRSADKIVVFDKGTIVEVGTHDELTHKRGLYYQINSQQKRGIDLVPAARHDSLIGPPSLNPALMQSADKQGLQQYTRESRSMSIYSATGKFAAGGLGATGHGGNGEGVDGGGGSCAPDSAADGKFNDDEYYNCPDDDDDEDDNDNDNGGAGATTTTTTTAHDGGCRKGRNPSCGAALLPPLPVTPTDPPVRIVVAKHQDGNLDEDGDFGATKEGPSNTTRGLVRPPHEETQCSLLDLESAALVNSKGRKVAHLSVASILKFIKPNVLCSLIGIVTSLLMGLCIPISAMIIGDIATIFATDNPEEIRNGLYTHGLFYISLAIFAFFVSFVQVVSFGVAGEKIGTNLRLRGFQAIMARDISWFDNKRNNPGSICARLASDVGNVQSITGNRTAVIFQSISILVSTFTFAVYYNLKFSSVCVTFVAILLISTVLQARYASKLALANRGFDSQIGKVVLESSANIKTLVSLHQEEYFIERCEQLLAKDRRCKSLDNHLRLSLESLKYAMTAISKGSSFYFAAHMLVGNEIGIDDIFKLIEIILYGLTEASKSLIFISDLEKARRGTQNLYKLICNNNNQRLQLDPSWNIKKCGGAFTAARKAKRASAYHQKPYLPKLLFTNPAGGERCRRFHNVDDEVASLGAGLIGGSKPSDGHKPVNGNISFDRVRFHYPSRLDACVLKSLSLEIEAGKSVALVGRSGCGKSTIVQLLQKFYDSFQGDIRVDGSDLRALPAEWIRKQIALVSQEPSLLSYTIGDNIRYGDNSREVHFDEVVQAAQTANIHDFIMSLPNAYDTQLSESNSLQLSGGQKQRIAIARALVRRAPILIFDEATSALDTKSEHIVQEALERAQVGKTSIIVAHRLSTIKNVDCVFVLKEGVVVEQGSHDELMERRGEYYCLYKTRCF